MLGHGSGPEWLQLEAITAKKINWVNVWSVVSSGTSIPVRPAATFCWSWRQRTNVCDDTVLNAGRWLWLCCRLYCIYSLPRSKRASSYTQSERGGMYAAALAEHRVWTANSCSDTYVHSWVCSTASLQGIFSPPHTTTTTTPRCWAPGTEAPANSAQLLAARPSIHLRERSASGLSAARGSAAKGL